MALSKTWTDWAVKLHTKTAQAGAAVHLHGITDQSLNTELQVLLGRGDGLPYNTFGAIRSGAPAGAFSTSQLKAFLDACGMTGMLIDADGTHPGVVMYFQKEAEGSTRDAANAGTHQSYTFANGILVPRTLSMSHGGDAVLAAGLIARKTSAVEPLVFNEADSLTASIYPTVATMFGLGPVDFNSTTFDGLDSVEVDFGLQVRASGADGDVFPTRTVIVMIQPVVRMSGVHVDITSTLTEEGKYYTAEQVVFYAKKRAEGATYTADGTAEHIKFTLGKCLVVPDAIQGDPKSINVTITPWYTAGGSPVAPMAINTASAIT